MSRCTSTVCNANLPLMVEETAAPATTSSLSGPVPSCRQYTPGPSLHVKSKIRWLEFTVSLEVCDDAKGFMITFHSCCHYFEHSVKNKQTLLSQCMELVTHTLRPVTIGARTADALSDSLQEQWRQGGRSLEQPQSFCNVIPNCLDLCAWKRSYR